MTNIDKIVDRIAGIAITAILAGMVIAAYNGTSVQIACVALFVGWFYDNWVNRNFEESFCKCCEEDKESDE